MCRIRKRDLDDSRIAPSPPTSSCIMVERSSTPRARADPPERFNPTACWRKMTGAWVRACKCRGDTGRECYRKVVE
jgi:hypothetical protein